MLTFLNRRQTISSFENWLLEWTGFKRFLYRLVWKRPIFIRECIGTALSKLLPNRQLKVRWNRSCQLARLTCIRSRLLYRLSEFKIAFDLQAEWLVGRCRFSLFIYFIFLVLLIDTVFLDLLQLYPLHRLELKRLLHSELAFPLFFRLSFSHDFPQDLSHRCFGF